MEIDRTAAVITDAATLGAVLREARRAANESAADLARAAGYNPAAISQLERGLRAEKLFGAIAAWNRLLGRYGLRLVLVLADKEDTDGND